MLLVLVAGGGRQLRRGRQVDSEEVTACLTQAMELGRRATSTRQGEW